MKKWHTIWLLAFVPVLLAGCKKDKQPTPPPPDTTLMEVELYNHFVPQPLKSYLFVSDHAGKVIAATECAADGSYVLMGDEGVAVPETFQVSILHFDIYWHSILLNIQTFQQVSRDSWKIGGSNPDTIGTVKVEYANLPDGHGAILLSTPGYYNLTASANPSKLNLYRNNDPVLVKQQKHADGPRYFWIDQVVPGQLVPVDFNAMVPAAEQSTSLPFDVAFCEASLSGFQQAFTPESLPMVCHIDFGNGQLQNFIRWSFPADRFTDFQTEISLPDPLAIDNRFIDRSFGPIPAVFNKLDVGIDIVSGAGPEVKLNTSGDFNVLAVKFSDLGPGEELLNWVVYTSDTTTQIRLPELPAMITDFFTGLRRDSMQLEYVETRQYRDFQSYGEFVGAMYKPDFPAGPERLNMHAYRKVVPQGIRSFLMSR
ncbi:MAG: hypothetical protein KKD74_07960 [Bacteroidetes bacterium]|nr:hypothetical protein [Bacteroidota bacterium]